MRRILLLTNLFIGGAICALGQMNNPSNPNSSVPANNPVIRGSAIQAPGSVSSVTVTWPSGTVAGDLAVITISGGFAASGTQFTSAGWTQGCNLSASGWSTGVFYKVLTSGDITTGSFTYGPGGTFNIATAVATFVGGTAGVRSIDCLAPGASSAATETQTSTGVMQLSDIALVFGSIRTASGGSTVWANRGQLLATATDTAIASGSLYASTISYPAGNISPSCSFSAGAGTANICDVVLVKGQ